MKNLKLSAREELLLDAKESRSINGGNRCGCACAYAGSGGSSGHDNAWANERGNLISKNYRLQDCKWIIWDGEVW